MQTTNRRRTSLRRAAVATLGFLGAALPGCAQDEAVVTLPDEYLGQWYYLGSSGGIAGTGRGDAATGWIDIRSNNTIARFDDGGAQLGVDAFTLTRGPSIFSTDDVWLLHAPGRLEQAVRLHDAEQLTLSDNVYDGFQFSYARSRPQSPGG